MPARPAPAPACCRRDWLGVLALCVSVGCWAAPGSGGAAARLSAPPPLPAGQLRLALSPGTAMVYEPRRLALPMAAETGMQLETPPSLGLEFRAPPSQQGPRSLLRVQLSGDAALQFRPRKGGLAVSYRAQF